MEPLRSTMQITHKQIGRSDTLCLISISPWGIPLWWDLIAPELERSIAHNDGESTLEDEWRALVTGERSCWVVYCEARAELRCVFTSYIHSFERKQVLFVALLSGKGFKEFCVFEPMLSDFAKACGCSAIQSFVINRVAEIVKKSLPQFEITHQVMVKKL